MKIRQPWLIRLLAFLAAWVVRAWIGTLRYRHRWEGVDLAPTQGRRLPRRYIYVCWHENLIVPIYHYSRPDAVMLTSQHADGLLLSETIRFLGARVVNGSTTRGGVEA